MKEKTTQKKIELLVDELGTKSLSHSISERRTKAGLTLMLDDIEHRCTVEQRHYQRMLTVRRVTVNALSCIVILLCTYYLIPHSDQYTFVFNGHLTDHSETINRINLLFAQ